MPVSTLPSLGEVSSVAEESTSSCTTPVSDSQQTYDDPGQTESLIPGEPVVLSCDASSQMKGCVGCARIKDKVRRWGKKLQ